MQTEQHKSQPITDNNEHFCNRSNSWTRHSGSSNSNKPTL